jgi:hypothetical protein
MWFEYLASDSRRLVFAVLLVALAASAVGLIVRSKLTLSTVVFGTCCLIWLAMMTIQLRQVHTVA